MTFRPFENFGRFCFSAASRIFALQYDPLRDVRFFFVTNRPVRIPNKLDSRGFSLEKSLYGGGKVAPNNFSSHHFLVINP